MNPRARIFTSQQPRGSPRAASNPADMIVKSGAYSKAEILEDKTYFRKLKTSENKGFNYYIIGRIYRYHTGITKNSHIASRFTANQCYNQHHLNNIQCATIRIITFSNQYKSHKLIIPKKTKNVY